MMAQLRPAPADGPGRISQLLPTVKCSNCGLPVPLADLGDHICAPPPPVPALPKPQVSPNQATSLLPQRLQNLVTPVAGPRPQFAVNRDARSVSPARSVQNQRPRIVTALNSSSAPPSSVYSPLRQIPDRYMNLPTPENRGRSPSTGSNQSSPSTARPYINNNGPPPSDPQLDTRVGGEGGMAGVGRRGFQAAVRATKYPPEQPAPMRSIPLASNKRTPSPPRYPRLQEKQPYREYESPKTATPPRAQREALNKSRSDRSRPATPSSGSDYGGLAYDSEPELEFNTALKSKGNPPPPLALSGSLLRSKSREGTANDRNGQIRHQKSSSSISSAEGGAALTRSNSSVIAHALGITEPKDYGKMGGPGLPRSGRSTSGSSSGSRSAYSRNTDDGNVGTGKLEKAMETLLEDVGRDETTRPTLSKSKSTGRQRTFGLEHGRSDSVDSRLTSSSVTRAQRSNTVQASPDTKPVKLPTRAKSEKDRSLDITPKRAKVCVRCEKRIEDGKWVQGDGGGVLCEKCWKNMYLPKCRRCNLPIEKQAVSSSDGQLKGKYHKECFNCHICHKPFPDKTFYVFDGKPLCAYHYHEQNDSLCAAASCGQPIEGPCAVSHTGDRYHPEHLLCEFSGYPRCRERLEDYFEVDGKMLCERHARMAQLTAGDNDENWAESTRAMKRKTRFMNVSLR